MFKGIIFESPVYWIKHYQKVGQGVRKIQADKKGHFTNAPLNK